MHFKIQKMESKVCATQQAGGVEKKIVKTQQQLKLLNKIQSMLHLQEKSSLIEKMERIFFGFADQKKKRQIYHLLDIWNDQADFKDVIAKSYERLNQNQHLYRQNQILSARVYMKVQQYFSSKDCYELYILTKQMKLVFSYDRYWWKRENLKQNWNNQLEKNDEKLQIITKVIKQLRASKNDFIIKLLNFLERIGLLITNKQVENKFMVKIERISSVIQRQLYAKSISLPLLDIIKSQKAKGNAYKNKQTHRQHVRKQLPNYYFYSQNEKGIDEIHKKYQQYEYLQQVHDYIQWMFPNHFKSIFNQDSHALSYVQSHLFQVSQLIGVKVLKSIVIFFDFLGIYFDVSRIKLQLISLQRLQNALINNTHNLLRIKRILAFLSAVGFRQIALALIDFLLEKTSTIKQLKNAHSQMVENHSKYGFSQVNNNRSAKIQCRLQQEQFPVKHMIFSRIEQYSQKVNK